jgi:hypothetical protein
VNPTCLTLLLVLVLGIVPDGIAQTRPAKNADVFEKVEMLVPQGDGSEKVKVRLRLGPDALVVESRKTGAVLKTIPYAGIKSAEYSYSKHPRWKAGAGAAAGSLLLAPVFLLTLPLAIPLAFSKSKRHWLTVRGEQDYVVLKLEKDNRKLVLPAFEVRSGVTVEALGESK